MDAAPPPDEPARLGLFGRLALLLVVPLFLVGPSLLPGHRFLPQAPVVYPPLSLEYPEAAARASAGMNQWTGDRVFPVLSDQREVRERVLAGESLLWEDDLSLGLPLLGNAIGGPFYPPNALALALPPDRAAAPLAILALLLAGAGLWALLARLGVGEAGCLVGALCLQGSGWGVANLHYGMKVDAALWLPWCLWAVEGLRAGERRAGPWLAVFVASSFLAGFPPIAAFVLGATGLAALVRLRRPRAWARFGLACALGLALAAVHLVPMAAASADSYRTVKGPEELVGEAAPAATSLGLVVPHLFGAPDEPTPPFGPVAAWWLVDEGDWERAQTAVPLEWDPFAGVATLLLALAGVAAAGRRALAPLGLLVLAFGWAQAWPGFALLYALPGLGGGAPTRALAVAWIAWAWLAALGVDGALRGGARRVAVALGTAAVAALAVAAAFADGEALVAAQERRWTEAHGTPLEEVRHVLPPERARATADHIAQSLALTGVAGALLAAAAVAGARRREPWIAGAALALLLAEVVAVSLRHVGPRDLGGVPLVPASEALEAVLLATGDGRALRYDPTPGGLGDVVDLARPNLLHLYGGRDVSAYVAFTPAAAVDYFGALDPRTRVRSGVGRLPDLALLDDPRLDAARVTCILSREPIEHPRLEVTYRLEGFCVHRRLRPAPRAWRPGAGDDLAGPYDRVPVDVVSKNRWRVDVGEEAGAILLSRAFVPGLVASRGTLARHPSGLAQLSVDAGAGPGFVDVRYRPAGWTLARFVAGGALLALAVWFRRARRGA